MIWPSGLAQYNVPVVMLNCLSLNPYSVSVHKPTTNYTSELYDCKLHETENAFYTKIACQTCQISSRHVLLQHSTFCGLNNDDLWVILQLNNYKICNLCMLTNLFSLQDLHRNVEGQRSHIMRKSCRSNNSFKVRTVYPILKRVLIIPSSTARPKQIPLAISRQQTSGRPSCVKRKHTNTEQLNSSVNYNA